jgi:hypothetical protein
VAARRPDLAGAARALLRRYADLRYGGDATDRPTEIAQFERHVARLRVPRETEPPLSVQRAT